VIIIKGNAVSSSNSCILTRQRQFPIIEEYWAIKMSIDAIQIDSTNLKTAISGAQRNVRLVIVILIVAALTITAVYGLNFRNLPISTKPADWATFGDFFGGIVNPITAVGSVFILYQTLMFTAQQTSLNIGSLAISILTLRQAQSERIFLELLTLWRKSNSDLKLLLSTGEVLSGDDVIRYFVDPTTFQGKATKEPLDALGTYHQLLGELSELVTNDKDDLLKVTKKLVQYNLSLDEKTLLSKMSIELLKTYPNLDQIVSVLQSPRAS
jgi:hypothetical protein